jgi:Catalase
MSDERPVTTTDAGIPAVRDASKFQDFIHSQKRQPDTGLRRDQRVPDRPLFPRPGVSRA